MSVRLNQIIAVEKGVKSSTTSAMSEKYKTIQKAQLFDGLARTYEPKDDGGEQFPPENTRVQQHADQLVLDVGTTLTELFNITATKDEGNCKACAAVVVDGKIVVDEVPPTTLLFLEKQLNDIHTFFSKLPVLDPAHNWTTAEGSLVSKTDPIRSAKTKKTIRPLVLYQATDKHPAQTDKITEDVIVGHWNQVKMSGAVSESKKKRLLDRVEQLQKAVKFAREEANSTEINERNIGEPLFNWLFE